MDNFNDRKFYERKFYERKFYLHLIALIEVLSG